MAQFNRGCSVQRISKFYGGKSWVPYLVVSRMVCNVMGFPTIMGFIVLTPHGFRRIPASW